MLDAFEAIQGKFRQIRSLTRRQKDHLKRIHGGNDTSNGNVNIYQILPAVFLRPQPKSTCFVNSIT